MFIEIDEGAFDCIEDVDDANDARIRIINRLFTSMIDEKNIVYASRRNLKKLLDCNQINPEVKKYISWIMKNYINVYACRGYIKKKIIASMHHEEVTYNTDETIIFVPFKKFRDVSETKMLTENENDSIFYQRIANYIYRRKHKSEYYKICFENDSYHGSHCSSKLEQVSQKNRQVLCIVDSDKPYNGGKRGSTYLGVKSAVNNAKKRIAIELYELPVREKENLLPPVIYGEFSDNLLIRVIVEYFSDKREISDYFDIKSGIKCKMLKANDTKWHDNYDELINCYFTCSTDVTTDCQDDDKYIIEGIGGNLCDNIASVLLSDDERVIDNLFRNLSKPKREEIKKNKKRIIELLPDYIIEYWEKIAECSFEWGCCLDTASVTRIPYWKHNNE